MCKIIWTMAYPRLKVTINLSISMRKYHRNKKENKEKIHNLVAIWSE